MGKDDQPVSSLQHSLLNQKNGLLSDFSLPVICSEIHSSTLQWRHRPANVSIRYAIVLRFIVRTRGSFCWGSNKYMQYVFGSSTKWTISLNWGLICDIIVFKGQVELLEVLLQPPPPSFPVPYDSYQFTGTDPWACLRVIYCIANQTEHCKHNYIYNIDPGLYSFTLDVFCHLPHSLMS